MCGVWSLGSVWDWRSGQVRPARRLGAPSPAQQQQRNIHTGLFIHGGQAPSLSFVLRVLGRKWFWRPATSDGRMKWAKRRGRAQNDDTEGMTETVRESGEPDRTQDWVEVQVYEYKNVRMEEPRRRRPLNAG